MSIRNNGDRFSTPNVEDTEDSAISTQLETSNLQQNPIQEFQFVTPTEFVELPSQGEFYPKGHPLHKVKDLEIRYMTAKDEDILTSKAYIKKGIAIDKFLQNVLVNKQIDVNTMLSGDKNALAIAARITGYGSEYKTKVVCPNCSEKSDFTFDLEECKKVYTGVPDSKQNKDVQFNEDAGTYSIQLPASKATATFRILTGADERKIVALLDNKKKMNLPDAGVTDQLKLMIVAINGHTDARDINKFIDQYMPAQDSKFLRETYKKYVPNVDLVTEFICESCDTSTEMEVPITVDFFWPRG